MNEKIMKQEAQFDWLKDEVHCLHEENYKLREENTHLGMLNADLEIYLKEHKARIDKAIEYLKLFDENSNLIDHSVIKGALTILKGSDKDDYR